MFTVLVANTKGGCGKTTIATHLAAAFAMRGLPTALADADRQRSSLAWVARRPDRAAAIAGLDWVKDITPAPRDTARLVIDVPAAMRLQNRTAVAVVGNWLRAKTVGARRLDRFLAGAGHAVVARLRDSALYTEATAEGLTLFDLTARRAGPAREGWAPLLQYIGSIAG